MRKILCEDCKKEYKIGPCVQCKKLYDKEYVNKNKLKRIEIATIWQKNNRARQNETKKKNYYKYHEKILHYKKEYDKLNWEKIKEDRRKRYKENPEFALKCRLVAQLGLALRKYSKTGKIMSSRKYGVDYDKIIQSLKPFPEDITLYHVDHIKPLHVFNLTNPIEVKEAFNPVNLRWLIAHDNFVKNGKY